jgi:hypothetical protein
VRAGNSAAQVSTERNEREPAIGCQLLELAQEPRVDRGRRVDRLERRAPREQLEDRLEAARARFEQALHELLARGVLERRRLVELARAQRLGEGLLEGAPDRHRLADGLHVR